MLSKNGGEVSVSSLAGKTVLLYFSASWCPPCKGFTPILAAFYNKLKDEKNFEVVFVTWDEEEPDFNEYYQGHMPWLSMKFNSESERQALTQKYDFESIPTLVVVNADSGELLTAGGRNWVVKDPSGASFPWKGQ